jgi:hypothetical protein
VSVSSAALNSYERKSLSVPVVSMFTTRWIPSVPLNHSGAQVSWAPATPAGTSVTNVQSKRSELDAIPKLMDVVVHDCKV